MGRKLLTAILLMGFASSSWALSLQEAKDKGLIGETTSGYVAIINNAPPPAQNLVKDVNDKRKQIYIKMAKQHGIGLNLVEQRAGQKAIERTASGHYFRIEGGAWQRK